MVNSPEVLHMCFMIWLHCAPLAKLFQFVNCFFCQSLTNLKEACSTCTCEILLYYLALPGATAGNTSYLFSTMPSLPKLYCCSHWCMAVHGMSAQFLKGMMKKFHLDTPYSLHTNMFTFTNCCPPEMNDLFLAQLTALRNRLQNAMTLPISQPLSTTDFFFPMERWIKAAVIGAIEQPLTLVCEHMCVFKMLLKH